MKIAVDARSLTTRPTGVGHYLLAAVNVWSAQRPDVEFLLLAHKPLHERAGELLRRAPNVRYAHEAAPLLPGNGLWWFLVSFARMAHSRRATHLWGAGGQLPPFPRGLTTLLTVHDLVWRTLPQTMSTKSRVAYSLLAGRSIRAADHVWAVSSYTARELERCYPRRRNAAPLVGSGLNPLRSEHRFTPEELGDIRRRYGTAERTLLYVGTLEPRKNLAFLLGLMPALARAGCRLVVVGCSGWGRTGIAAIVGAPDYPHQAVTFCDYVPDPDLQGLYRVADFFVSTSLLEGFGLPHLEAMSSGCPVIAAANSAVVEVVGEGGILVDGWDPDEWVAAILGAFERAAALREAARRSAQRHTLDTACRMVSRALEGAADVLPQQA